MSYKDFAGYENELKLHAHEYFKQLLICVRENRRHCQSFTATLVNYISSIGLTLASYCIIICILAKILFFSGKESLLKDSTFFNI